jgi:hypothetical protein
VSRKILGDTREGLKLVWRDRRKKLQNNLEVGNFFGSPSRDYVNCLAGEV